MMHSGKHRPNNTNHTPILVRCPQPQRRRGWRLLRLRRLMLESPLKEKKFGNLLKQISFSEKSQFRERNIVEHLAPIDR